MDWLETRAVVVWRLDALEGRVERVESALADARAENRTEHRETRAALETLSAELSRGGREERVARISSSSAVVVAIVSAIAALAAAFLANCYG